MSVQGELKALAYFVAGLFVVLFPLMYLAFGSIGPVTEFDTFQVVTVLLSLTVFAAILSIVKHRWQLFYGVAESGAALYSAYYTLKIPPSNETRLALLAGTVYILSRGINNIWDAWGGASDSPS